MKSHFHMTGLAPRLVLRKRLKVIRKWAIEKFTGCMLLDTNYYSKKEMYYGRRKLRMVNVRHISRAEKFA